MQYPVVINQQSDREFNVIVPDIPGCISSGHSMEAALQQASETIELYIDGLTQSGKPIPSPRRIRDHQDNAQYARGVWALVTVDISKHLGKSKRINITMPERLLMQIDKYIVTKGGNRSAFLAEAAMNYISRSHYQAETQKDVIPTTVQQDR